MHRNTCRLNLRRSASPSPASSPGTRGKGENGVPWHAHRFATLAITCSLALSPTGAQQPATKTHALAQHYFGADAPWFERNIPFLQIDDPELEQVYFYRWAVFRAHIREIGAQGTTVLEFLPDVPWAREPWTDLNDSSAFHLMEGRWMRSPAVTNSLIDHLYQGGGNDRHFSEWIAAAALAATDVSGDTTALDRNFAGMQQTFDAWNDHLSPGRNLYWIEPIADATEYTISSIDASGAGFTTDPSTDPANNGFLKGFSYRPSINTYQYGNAFALGNIAERLGKPALAAGYRARAAQLQQATLQSLWNPQFNHFMDRYQRSTPFVQEGNFIRGRELVGYLPWLLELVPKDAQSTATYSKAWSHVLNPGELRGAAGVRTVEPTYARYRTQYRYEGVHPECQWNGPSWPFQTSQMLTGLANLLDDYPNQHTITSADYLSLLRQYTQQHYLRPGVLDLQEDYDPDHGSPIVGLPRSHHYEHSTYVDLILSGLLGVRAHADDVFELAPLLPATPTGEHPIRYFALTQLRYHGHDLDILYDTDGTHLHAGRGLHIRIDGKQVFTAPTLQHVRLPLPPAAIANPGAIMPEDLAVNVGIPGGPTVKASSSATSDGPQQAIDGRLWFFPEIPNGWTPAGDPAKTENWLELRLPRPQLLRSVELYFLGAGAFHAPPAVQLEYNDGTAWKPIPSQTRLPLTPISNGRNQINFPPLETDQLRLTVSPTSTLR